jgi:hypothetical protein
MATGKPGERAKVTVGSVNVPGYSNRVDAIKYGAMKKALLKVVPRTPPGMTQSEMWKAVKPHLPQDEFPGGAKAEWWAKCVQLDLEAKGVLVRDAKAKPLRWRRVR